MNVVEVRQEKTKFHTLDIKFTADELEVLNTGRYSMEIYRRSERVRIKYKQVLEKKAEVIIDIVLGYYGKKIELNLILNTSTIPSSQ